MSFGIDIRNSVAIGLGGIATLASGGVSGGPTPPSTWNVLDSAGTSYSCTTSVLDSSGVAYVCGTTVLDSAGNPYTPT